MKRKRIILLAVLAFIIFVFGFYVVFFIHFVKIPTGAMKNTIFPGDRLAINRIYGEVKRGDIVTFKYPQDKSILFLQRVIGLPGENIQIRDKKVYINDIELPERRIMVEPAPPDDMASMKELSSDGEGNYNVLYYKRNPGELDFSQESFQYAVKEPFQIPEDSYFLMGDNRDNSLDSRFWGVVPGNLITGKAIFIYWSEDIVNKETRWGRVFSKLK